MTTTQSTSQNTGRRRSPSRRVSATTVAGIGTLGVAVVGALVSAAPAHAATPVAPSIGVSLQPIDTAVATYAHRAYVATDQYVDVVDTTTNTRTTMISTGLTDQTAISLVQAGAKVYVGSFADAKMVIIDPTTDTVTGTVKVGKGTTSITDVVTPKGEFAYLTQYGKKRSRVTVVDASTDRVVSHIHVAGAPVAAAQSPDLKQVWVGTASGENVKVIKPTTGQVTRTIAMPRSGPVGGIAFGARGNQAYVTGLGGLTAVRVHSGTTAWFKSAPKLFPRGGGLNVGPIAVGPHRTIWVVNATFPDAPGRGTVAVLSQDTHRVLSRTHLGGEPTSITMDPMGRQAYFTDYATSTLSYVSTRK